MPGEPNSPAPGEMRRATRNHAAALSAFAARTFQETFAHSTSAQDMAGHLAEHYGVPQQSSEIADRRCVTLDVRFQSRLTLLRLGRRRSSSSRWSSRWSRGCAVPFTSRNRVRKRDGEELRRQVDGQQPRVGVDGLVTGHGASARRGATRTFALSPTPVTCGKFRVHIASTEGLFLQLR